MIASPVTINFGATLFWFLIVFLSFSLVFQSKKMFFLWSKTAEWVISSIFHLSLIFPLHSLLSNLTSHKITIFNNKSVSNWHLNEPNSIQNNKNQRSIDLCNLFNLWTLYFHFPYHLECEFLEISPCPCEIEKCKYYNGKHAITFYKRCMQSNNHQVKSLFIRITWIEHGEWFTAIISI